MDPAVDQASPSAPEESASPSTLKSLLPTFAFLIAMFAGHFGPIGNAISYAVMVSYILFLIWRGFRRRREHWTIRSWAAFIAVLLAGAALSAFFLYFSWDTDRSWVGARGSDARSLWILTALASMIVGISLMIVPMMWFAHGEPTRQFSLRNVTNFLKPGKQHLR